MIPKCWGVWGNHQCRSNFTGRDWIIATSVKVGDSAALRHKVFYHLTKEQYKEVRKNCIESILHTDMMAHQAAHVL